MMFLRILYGLLAATLACEAAVADRYSRSPSGPSNGRAGRATRQSIPDGRVWFVGQAGNYIGVFDPQRETFRRYELEPNTLPHNLIVGSDGGIWYAGNGNARIGRLDPATGDDRTSRCPTRPRATRTPCSRTTGATSGSPSRTAASSAGSTWTVR
jgi:streptogramin lyase